MDYQRVYQDFQNAQTTVFGALKEASERYPDSPAIGFFGRSVSFKKLISDIEKIAKGLLAAGVGEGDTVTFMLPNCPQAVMVYYAISRIGAVANMIHTLSSVENIVFFLNKADSRFLVTLDALYPKAKAASEKAKNDITIIHTSISDEMPIVTKIGYQLKTIKGRPEKISDRGAVSLNEITAKGKDQTLPPVKYEENRTATILYSGGSTGAPKGICLSDYNINSLAIQVANAAGHRICPGLKFLSAMPMFHGFGLGVGIHTFICNGAQCILVPQFTLDAYVKTLLKEKTNMLAIVPTMLEAFLRSDAFDGKDLSFLKGIFSGADATNTALQNRMNNFLREHHCEEVVREGYGLTESVTACALNPRENVKIGSIGLPLGETKFRVVKPGTFQDVPVGENGELIIHGPTVMLGYLNEPEETENTLKTDADGLKWLFTGDMVKMDEDGYTFFIQRIKRLIITSGFNVYPTQVEQAINACPGVEASCVVGVKDRFLGQKVVACVVLQKDVDEKKARSEIMDTCKKKLEEYAIPSKIEFVSELPLTNMGKIDFTRIEQQQNEKAGKKNV